MDFITSNIHILLPNIIGGAFGALCPMTGSGPRTNSQPPGWVFGVVWPILYLLIGMNWNLTKADKTLYMMHWLLIIALNAWVYIVGCKDDYKSGALTFLPVVALSFGVWMMSSMKADELNVWYLPLLLVPYIAWILFAQQLNVHIVEKQSL